LFSSNQSFTFADKTIRSLVNLKSNSSDYVFNATLNDVLSSYSHTSDKFELNPYFFYKMNFSKWSNPDVLTKTSLNRFNVELPYAPIPSSNPLTKLKEFDNAHSSIILQGREELTSSTISSIYWNFYFNTFNSNWRLVNPLSFFALKDSFYLPVFSFYYDYDFRNWQAFELLEDAFWESAFSIYLNDEYSTILSHVDYLNDFDKNLISFLSINSLLNDAESSMFDSPFSLNKVFKDESSYFDINKTPYIFQEDGILNPQLLSFKDFSFLTNSSTYSNIEDSYESFKNTSLFLDSLNYSLFLTSKNYFQPLIYSAVLDAFRSDFDEFSWISESNPFQSTSDENLFNLNLDEENLRSSNLINLRNTAKNAIVTYGAIQKVFKTRLDENRSNAKLGDFSSSFTKQPFVSAKKAPYEDILGKNKINFFDNLVFMQNFKKNIFTSNLLDSSLNFYIYDFPFLMALKSDPSRYLWFDWFARWGFYEVQPSSSSRYAIFGMPYFNKAFEYNSTINESLNETENYFIRLARSRKNYMTNWVHSPYMLAKNSVWNRNHKYFEISNYFNSNELIKTKFILKTSNWFWSSFYLFKNVSNKFFPSFSNINTYNRAVWTPQNSAQSYYYLSSSLVDILTKRESMYRDYFFKKNKIINLPLFLTSNPNNSLLKELKASFLYVDKIVNQNEYSRDFYYHSLNYFNYTVLSAYKKFLSESLNLTFSADSLFFYFFNSSLFTPSFKNNNNIDLFKNQYRPMKKGINNMVRLHATGAIAMPIEMRIQILASSKDVIHSWAIPSAGIKIDCVPGYSSHRVIIFLVSGIFWGQCMEICGRYHHWMPIIIYFMKRDLFFLWCTHFIFLNSTGNSLVMNDRQNVNFAKLVSYDKSSWINQF
jgi:heme/copper-type cytochrome/quinol oxidase subunit 2